MTKPIVKPTAPKSTKKTVHWSEAADKTAASEPSDAPKILLVDDSAFIRRDLKQTLSSKYTILEARDGAEGLRIVHETPDLDLVFCDVNMPTMDGLQMCERVAAHARVNKRTAVPIVMLTTENTKEAVLRAKRAGVVGWLIKPADKNHILQIAEKFTQKKTAKSA